MVENQDIKGVDVYIECVYTCMPTQGLIKHLCTDRFDLFEEDVCLFCQRENFVYGGI